MFELPTVEDLYSSSGEFFEPDLFNFFSLHGHQVFIRRVRRRFQLWTVRVPYEWTGISSIYHDAHLKRDELFEHYDYDFINHKFILVTRIITERFING